MRQHVKSGASRRPTLFSAPFLWCSGSFFHARSFVIPPGPCSCTLRKLRVHQFTRRAHTRQAPTGTPARARAVCQRELKPPRCSCKRFCFFGCCLLQQSAMQLRASFYTAAATHPRAHTVHSHAPTCVHAQELEEGPATILKTLKEIPGVCLFPFWLAMYACVCVITRKLSKRASCQGKTATLFTSDEYAEMQQFWTLGAACFGVVVMVQTANIIFQISAKKRILGSLVFFINAVACSTYVAQARGWIVPVIDSKGREVQIARYRAFSCTCIIRIRKNTSTWQQVLRQIARCWAFPSTCTLLVARGSVVVVCVCVGGWV